MAGENENLDVKKTASGGLEDSSTTENQEADVNANVSMLDFVKKSVSATADDETEVKDEETKSEESSTEEGQEAETQEEEAKESDSEIESDKTEDEESKKEDEESKEKESEEKEESEDEKEEHQEAVPYERFQEVNEKLQKVETDFQQAKPIVEHHTKIVQYCEAKGISQQQFSEGLEVMGLINTNPKEALVRLNKLVEDLQGFTGDKLPEDLQSKVDSGKLELADARELAQARAQARFGERSLAQYKATQAQQQAVAMQRAMLTAVNSWVDSKKTDPDFKPKAKQDDVDGKWERVYDKIAAMLNQVDGNGKKVNSADTPQDMTALMERAYQAVTKSMGSAKGKPATRRVLSHNGSSKTSSNKTIEGAKTMREAIAIGLAQR